KTGKDGSPTKFVTKMKKAGWLGGGGSAGPVEPGISGYPCRQYEIKNVRWVTKTRREHLRDRKALGLDNFEYMEKALPTPVDDDEENDLNSDDNDDNEAAESNDHQTGNDHNDEQYEIDEDEREEDST